MISILTCGRPNSHRRPGGEGEITHNNSGFRIEMYAHNLPSLHAGEYYQAWLKNASGTAVPIGTFSTSDDHVTLWSGVSPDVFPTMTVTIESTDNNQGFVRSHRSRRSGRADLTARTESRRGVLPGMALRHIISADKVGMAAAAAWAGAAAMTPVTNPTPRKMCNCDPFFVVSVARQWLGESLRVALERAAERLLGVVADPAGDGGDAEVGRGEQLLGQVHAPLGEVADRRPAEHLAEALVEQRAGDRGAGGELGDRPVALRRAVQQRQRGREHRIAQRREPAVVGGGRGRRGARRSTSISTSSGSRVEIRLALRVRRARSPRARRRCWPAPSRRRAVGQAHDEHRRERAQRGIEQRVVGVQVAAHEVGRARRRRRGGSRAGPSTAAGRAA